MMRKFSLMGVVPTTMASAGVTRSFSQTPVCYDPERVKGKVTNWMVGKGFGFITGPDEKQYFVHFNELQVQLGGYKALVNGQEVTFEPLDEIKTGKKKAMNVLDVKGELLPGGPKPAPKPRGPEDTTGGMGEFPEGGFRGRGGERGGRGGGDPDGPPRGGFGPMGSATMSQTRGGRGEGSGIFGGRGIGGDGGRGGGDGGRGGGDGGRGGDRGFGGPPRGGGGDRGFGGPPRGGGPPQGGFGGPQGAGGPPQGGFGGPQGAGGPPQGGFGGPQGAGGPPQGGFGGPQGAGGPPQGGFGGPPRGGGPPQGGFGGPPRGGGGPPGAGGPPQGGFGGPPRGGGPPQGGGGW